ncbi:MAG TPA: hypothetical protein VFO16_13165 [Pseudonocardiaceae bacterium]|nr:hypothetical protein [Pseudonocardiaceae bacterium]
MLVPVVLLLAAIGFLVPSLSPGYSALAWVSVGLSVVAAVLVLRRWRRSWAQRQEALEDEPELLTEGELSSVAGSSVTPSERASSPAEQPAQPQDNNLGEEDTDAADVLVVYDLTDEVLVVDEHPRYHLARCRLPEHERAERLPVKEARELGFTPCERCRPDKALARKHRAARTTATGGSQAR